MRVVVFLSFISQSLVGWTGSGRRVGGQGKEFLEEGSNMCFGLSGSFVAVGAGLNFRKD
jgi:hypothetical protein